MTKDTLLEQIKATDYQSGDFGHAIFTSERKCFKTKIDCYGTIKHVEKKYLLFADNDGFEFLISKKEFVFEKCEKPVLK